MLLVRYFFCAADLIVLAWVCFVNRGTCTAAAGNTKVCGLKREGVRSVELRASADISLKRSMRL